MIVELIAHTPDPEKVIERAGRICYGSTGSDPLFIRRRIEDGHESIIEHASATFHFAEISRACSHQIVRHRMASVSQQSQRYVKADAFEYVVPEKIASNAELLIEYRTVMECLQDFYGFLTREGVKPEDARFILPNACHTEMIFTANFRSWRNFLKLRLDRHAQWEIRALAQKIGAELLRIAPNVFYDFEQQITFYTFENKIKETIKGEPING